MLTAAVAGTGGRRGGGPFDPRPYLLLDSSVLVLNQMFNRPEINDFWASRF